MEALKQIYYYNKLKYLINNILNSKQTAFTSIELLDQLTGLISCQNSNIVQFFQLIKNHVADNIHNSFKVLKMLVVLDCCIQKLKNQENLDFLQINVRQISEKLKQLQRIAENIKNKSYENQSKINNYYRKNLLLPFCWNILRKLQFLKQWKFYQNKRISQLDESNQFRTNINSKSNLHYKVINNIKSITSSQIHFYQIGRYYSNHQLINNLFLQYLKTLSKYLDFLRQTCSSYSRQVFIVSKAKLQSNHLLIIQSQKVLNSIFSFYYNKYLFHNIEKHIKIQVSLNLPQSYYQNQQMIVKQKIVQQNYVKSLSVRSNIFDNKDCQTDNVSQTDTSQNDKEITHENKFKSSWIRHIKSLVLEDQI